MQESEVNYEDKILKDLQSKIDAFKQQLLSILEASYYYRNVLEPRLVFWYESIFGDIEDELESKSRIATELQRRAELLRMRLDRGEKITDQTVKFIDVLVSKESQKAKANSGYSNQPIKEQNDNHKSDNTYKGFTTTSDGGFFTEFQNNRTYNKQEPKQNNGSTSFRYSQPLNYNPYMKMFRDNLDEFRRDRQIPFLYRNIVKRLHPDIVGNSDDFQKYWEIVQEAYKSKNLERLSIFFQTLCGEDNIDKLNFKEKHQYLYNKQKGLELSIQIEKRKLDKLKTEEPFNLEDKLSDRYWVAKQKRSLQDKLFQINRQIQSSRQALLSLTGHRWNNDGVLESNNSSMFGKSYYSASYVASK
jgi:hypothetical protein